VKARRREIPTLEINDSQYYRVVGRHITAARQRRDLSQAELGRAIGADVRTVSAYERGTRDPALWRARRIAAALAVPIGSLATEREPRR
jgi:DNA-binding XRE family transcriptional regulator